MSTFTVIVQPGWSFPEGQKVDLAALRAGATPVITLEGTFSSTTIADGAITEPKLATGAVTESKIGAGAVTTTKIADDAVTAAKIAEGSIDDSHINGQLTADVIEAFTGEQGGVVSANSSADRNNFLRGDGRWADPTYNAVTAIMAAQQYI